MAYNFRGLLAIMFGLQQLWEVLLDRLTLDMWIVSSINHFKEVQKFEDIGQQMLPERFNCSLEHLLVSYTS